MGEANLADGLATYVNDPSTEYLGLAFLDFASLHVYLGSRSGRRPISRVQNNIAGERLLLMSVLGLDAATPCELPGNVLGVPDLALARQI